MLDKIISGGPTGVDRAALDVALGLGLAGGRRVSARPVARRLETVYVFTVHSLCRRSVD